MRRLPSKMLDEHGVNIHNSNGKPEPAWQQVLRLNQSLWRQEQKLDAMPISSGFLGSCLASASARGGRNLMSDSARRAAARELEQPDKVIRSGRLFENLLTSQALCFSLFGGLQGDLPRASRVISALLEMPVEVTRIELEHSPGRGDLKYTGDHSAADAYIEYTAGNCRGFLCVEIKYFEDLVPAPDWKDRYRPRYSEVAAGLGCFQAGSEAVLREPPLEQLWRDHLLAGSILQHPEERFDEGYFVLVYPEMNEACARATKTYRGCLTNEDTFRVWTLESVVDALQEHADYEWAASLKDRYLNYRRVDQVYQDHYLKETTRWAKTTRDALGALQIREGHRVWFRPSSSGFSMVGLLPGKPQMGKACFTATHILRDFESQFSRHCDGPSPKRSTPEKRLQSHLVSDALSHSRNMQRIDDALIFLTDELTIPSISGAQRLDVLALRRTSQGARLALLELKSERAMAVLLRQTEAYSKFLDNHSVRLAELASAILGESVLLTKPTEKWIVWPKAENHGEDPRISEFMQAGVRVVAYREIPNGFEFEIGPQVKST